MAWFCQRECYATTLETTVESCEEATESSLKLAGLTNDATGKFFEVVFADTVLFPEGGGQPDDRGTIELLETGEQKCVLRVLRNGQKAVHYVKSVEAINAGTRVRQTVDWSRRFDHMQQHSGQHLITAVLEGRFGWKTTSWNLGESMSTIELEKLSDSDSAKSADKPQPDKKGDKSGGKGDQKTTCELDPSEIESVIDQHILNNLKLNVKLIHSLEDPELKKARTRGLPADVPLPIRLVSIGEGETCLDMNLCCGTHVRSLSDLQSIAVLGITSSKKGKATLSFLAGRRVLRYTRSAYVLERQITGLLNVPADQHADALKRTQLELRTATKMNLTLLRETAILEARVFMLENQNRVKEAEQGAGASLLYTTHRKDADTEYMNVLINELDRLTVSAGANSQVNLIAFLSTGDDRKDGNFVLAAPPSLLGEISPRVNELLEAKAFTNKTGTRFQGRTSKMVARKSVLEFLNEFIAKKTSE